MIMKKIWYVLSSMLLIVFLTSCPNDLDSDGDGVVDEIDKEQNTSAKYITSVDQNGKASINSVYMLLDNTGSMNGYKNGGSEFLDAISTLAGSINSCKTNQEIHNVTYQNYGSDALSSELNFSDFSSLLSSPASKDGSNIVNHFKTLTNSVSDSCIGIYITDAIISVNGGNNEKIASICKAELIPYCTKVLGKPENGAIVLRCKSKFNGSYQSSANPKKFLDLNDPARPYFIFLFGKRSSLDFFIDKVAKNNPSLTNNITDISFINYEPMVSLQGTIDMSTTTGSWALSDKPNTINYFGNDALEIPLGLDLSFITNLNPNIALLKQNIIVENGEILGFDTRDKFLANNPNIDKSAYSTSTHIVKIKYNSNQIGQPSHIYLNTNKWYDQYSTSDDSSIEAIKPKTGSRKTFELDKIIGSIFAASQISRDNPNLHITTVNFSKQ